MMDTVITPSDEIFNEIKSAAIDLWKTKDNGGVYVKEKVKLINLLKNIERNAMVIYWMFDVNNQEEMRDRLSQNSNQYIRSNKNL